MTEVMDWDSVYREEGGVCDGPPPWNISASRSLRSPKLIRADKFRSDVHDSGCGFGEASLHLAAPRLFRGRHRRDCNGNCAATERG
jgi:hypothetical protein